LGAFSEGCISKITSPVHRYLFEGEQLNQNLTSQYKEDLGEGWLLQNRKVDRLLRKSKIYMGKLVELQCAEWFEKQGWKISNLEALGVVSPNCCENLSPIIVRIRQVWNPDVPVLSPVATPKMRTDTALRCTSVRIVAVVQDHQLDIAEDGLDRVVIRAAFGQTDPVQVQGAHDLTGLLGFARMSGVLIQDNPDHRVGIPLPDATHQATHPGRAFAWKKRPSHPSSLNIIQQEQIE
jgi:hypothetical protein